MNAGTKKLGEMLVDAGLITPAQLQEALRHQRAAGGRMGSNLVAMGIISDDLLMDFLARQTGVPRVDVRNLDIPASILERIPRRLAEQLVILPVAFKEPKSLVMAMADPSDLNAVDSARFASGMSIEPVVASHSALKQAIVENYRRLESGSLPMALEVGGVRIPEGGLSVPYAPPSDPRSTHPSGVPLQRDQRRDPFFSGTPTPIREEAPNPFSFFTDPKATPAPPPAPAPAPKPTDSQIIHARSSTLGEQVKPIENYGTRALVLGLVKILQRRGIVGETELQHIIMNMPEIRDGD